jgi:hypothetical protein
MAWHIDGIKDVSKLTWFDGTAADYRAEVKRLAPKLLEWHGSHEATRYGYVQRHTAAEALGYPATHAALAGEAYYHLRDLGQAEVDKRGTTAVDWYWKLSSKGLDATAKAYIAGHED